MTEPQYIDALSLEPEVHDLAAVSLRIEAANQGEVPLTLVRRAVNLKRRDGGQGNEIDEIWCVFDVEWPRNHPNLKQAMDLAEANGIKLAVSNPCFEVWLIWHFCDAARFLSNDGARKLRRELDGRSSKHIDAQTYMIRRAQAARLAERQDAVHLKNGTNFPHNNPSSGMYLLVGSVSPDGWLGRAPTCDDASQADRAERRGGSRKRKG